MPAPITIAGLGKKENSPIAPVAAELGGPLLSWEDIEKDWAGFIRDFQFSNDVQDLVGHSLGAYCCILIAARPEMTREIIDPTSGNKVIVTQSFRITAVDTVPGTLEEPWLQFNAKPIQLTPNVVSC